MMDKVLETMRDVPGFQDYTAAWAEGQALTLEQALEVALLAEPYPRSSSSIIET